MIATIALIASLLLAGTSEAGFSEIVIDQHGNITHAMPLNPDGKPYSHEARLCIARGHSVDICEAAFPIEDPCLAKMEAAMAAVEPYLYDPRYFDKDPVKRYRWEKQRDEAIVLFLETKRECWRTP